MKATYNNSFCIADKCIHYFETMCMEALSEKGTDIEPLTDLRGDIKDCQEFSLGTFLIYEVDLEEDDYK